MLSHVLLSQPSDLRLFPTVTDAYKGSSARVPAEFIALRLRAGQLGYPAPSGRIRQRRSATGAPGCRFGQMGLSMREAPAFLPEARSAKLRGLGRSPSAYATSEGTLIRQSPGAQSCMTQ